MSRNHPVYKSEEEREDNDLACTIVLLSFNGGPILRETIVAVLSQETSAPFEVLVIDSGSTDGSIDFLQSQPVKLIQIPNSTFGHGATRNLGVQHARSPIVVFLSQDATPASGTWLTQLLAPFRSNTVGAVYGRQLPRDTHACETFFLEKTYPPAPKEKRIEPGRQRLTLRDVFFSNVNSACRRELLERYPLDEHLVMSEDQMLAKNILLCGNTIVYAPEAAVWHSHRYTLTQVFRRYFDSGASLHYIVPGGVGDPLMENIRYVIQECSFALKNEGLRAAVFAVVYECARIAGFYTGKMERFLPLFLKLRLSAFPGFWNKR